MRKSKCVQSNADVKRRPVLVQVSLADPQQVVAMDMLVKKFRSSRAAVLRLGLDFLSERELPTRVETIASSKHSPA